MRYTCVGLLALLDVASCLPKPSIQLQDNLDEPNNLGFCIDLMGFGTRIKLDQV